MLSSVQGFVNRHRRAFGVTTGVAVGITGGVYLMGRYAKNKLIEFQEKTAAERTAKENMKRRFEQNQQDCVFTVLSLLPTLGDQLLHELDVELITSKLKQTRSQRSTPAITPEGSMILVNHSDTKDDDDEKFKVDEKALDKQPDQEPGTDDHTNKTPDDTQANHTKDDSSDGKEIPQDVEAATSQTKAIDADSTLQTVASTDETAASIDRRTKLELWNELKIMSFTRTITALYSLTFLTLLTQLQLNLLGRFTYVSSVVALGNTTDPTYRIESPSAKGSYSSTNGYLDFQTEKKYLTFSYWLLHEGWRRWSEKVQQVVENVIGSMSLKKTLNANEFSDLLGEIRTQLEYTIVDGKREAVNMREYLLPDDPAEEREVLRAGGVDEFDLVVDPVLRNLLDETRDFIDSPDFATVLSSSVATTFARFNLSLQPTFSPFLTSPPRSTDSGIEEITQGDADCSIPLATLLPLVSRQVHLIINGVPNDYLDALSMVKDLQAFSAIVYSSFSEDLIHG
ncbi:Peroxin-3 [Mortierella sp. GBAus27b]|nr:peroxin [Mortierella sp. GBA43]KAI8361919.1 Peroxin-3 [Mortierella sp. GBAus27b]